MKLYSFYLSGNAYKVRLLLSLLKLEYELIESPTTVVKDGSTVTNKPEFLALNPKAEVPVLVDDENVIADSGAICFYLASQYDTTQKWLPKDSATQARIIYWIATAANEIRWSIAQARRFLRYGDTQFDFEICQNQSHKLLRLIEQSLKESKWLASEDHPTIADIVCYPYIELCHEGKISLQDYPQIQNWLNRIEQLDGYIFMKNNSA